MTDPVQQMLKTFALRVFAGLFVVACALLASTAYHKPDAPPEPAVVEIPAGGVEYRPGRAGPIYERIDSPEALGAIVPGAQVYRRLRDAIDFDTSYYLLFRWTGSGGAQLSVELDADRDPPRAVFRRGGDPAYSIERHVHLYKVRRDVAWTLAE